MWFPENFILFTPEALATYVVGGLAVFAGIKQLQRNLRLNKNSKVFDELSGQITKAKKLLSSIESSANSLIDLLAREADLASNFAVKLANATQNEQVTEVQRRLEQLSVFEKEQMRHISAIYDSQEGIINIVEQIDKSTVISNGSKEAAKYVFHAATDQHELVRKANNVILSLNVIPQINEVPNITPQTFRSIIELYAVITANNKDISNYLDDLEVILHNDLVEKVFGTANRGELPNKYLTKDGLKDRRVKKPLR